MTAQAIQFPLSGASRWERVRYAVAAVPWHGLKTNGNQALITFAATYAGAMFSMQHNVFPLWIAVPLAVGFEWTYLAGIALAGDIRKGGWSVAISITAMLTSAVFGILYILGVYKVIPDQPTGEDAVWLACAHIVPITLMSFFYAMAHRAHHAQRIADADERAARAQEREDEQHELEQTWRAQQLGIEMERKQIDLERDRMALRQAQARLDQQVARATSATTPQPAVAPVAPRKPIVYEGVEYPTIQAAADAHGITRQAMSKRLRNQKRG
jgi:hypothetical protein